MRLCILTAILLAFSVSLASGATFTIYATANRDGYVYWLSDLGDCSGGNSYANNDLASNIAGYRQINDGGDIEYLFYRSNFSFDLSTVTGTVDSARVFIGVQLKAVSCTGDLNLGIYVDTCAIGGDCTTALARADSSRPVAAKLIRQWPISTWPVSGEWVSYKIPPDSLYVRSGGPAYDIRIAATANEVGAGTRVCACADNTGDRMTFNTVEATAGSRPYILVYTTTAGVKRSWGQVKADDPDVWTMRKELVK